MTRRADPNRSRRGRASRRAAFAGNRRRSRPEKRRPQLQLPPSSARPIARGHPTIEDECCSRAETPPRLKPDDDGALGLPRDVTATRKRVTASTAFVVNQNRRTAVALLLLLRTAAAASGRSSAAAAALVAAAAHEPTERAAGHLTEHVELPDDGSAALARAIHRVPRRRAFERPMLVGLAHELREERRARGMREEVVRDSHRVIGICALHDTFAAIEGAAHAAKESFLGRRRGRDAREVRIAVGERQIAAAPPPAPSLVA